MQRKTLGNMQCPIARSLERVGEWWSILILRDAFHGLSRFDQFQKSLEIAPNMLTRRLAALVESGLLERRRYSERPPRYEYLLTERGRDFRPVLWALLAWGNKHFAPEGASVVIVDRATGAPADPVLVDRLSGRVLAGADGVVAAARATLANLAATRRLQEATIAQVKAEVTAADAEAARAGFDVVRYRRLAADQFASTQRFQQADADHKKGIAAADRTRAAVAAAERQLEVID